MCSLLEPSLLQVYVGDCVCGYINDNRWWLVVCLELIEVGKDGIRDSHDMMIVASTGDPRARTQVECRTGLRLGTWGPSSDSSEDLDACFCGAFRGSRGVAIPIIGAA
jgi:hypothetical protein